jgi:2,4-dichlorophenol 6-monooxygenase
MIGPDRLQSFIMIHFEADLRHLVRDRPAILYWTVDPECSGVFVAHAIDHTWVFMHPYDPDAESVDTYTEAHCAAIVQRAIGRDDVAFVIRDRSPWTMTAQVAASYRSGRVFLVGDAAHRFPPTGGMGMNTGIQDAHNLAWKLRAVRDSRAGAALLDTYESERRPIAQTNSEQSMMNALKMFEIFDALGVGTDLSADRVAARARMHATLADPAGRARIATAFQNQRDHFDMFGLQLGFAYEEGALVADGTPKPAVENVVRDYVATGRPGARVPHAWIERGGARLSMLDLLQYDRFTLLAGADGAAWADAVRSLDHPGVSCLVAGRDFTDRESTWAGRAGIGRDGALLIRPDQHVGWRAPTTVANPAGQLSAALATILARA